MWNFQPLSHPRSINILTDGTSPMATINEYNVSILSLHGALLHSIQLAVHRQTGGLLTMSLTAGVANQQVKI